MTWCTKLSEVVSSSTQLSLAKKPGHSTTSPPQHYAPVVTLSPRARNREATSSHMCMRWSPCGPEGASSARILPALPRSIRNQFDAQIHVRFAAVSRLSRAVSRCGSRCLALSRAVSRLAPQREAAVSRMSRAVSQL
eukprot:6022168-Prymnesium_polylepis.1